MAYDERERVGAMLRGIVADVNAEFIDVLENCYTLGKKISDVGLVCWKWHVIIERYVVDDRLKDGLVDTIQVMFEKNLNLDAMPGWKKLMRIHLPPQYNKKMQRFSQIVQVATMDKTKLDKKDSVRDVDEILW